MAVRVGDRVRVNYEGRVITSNDVEFTLDTGYTHMFGRDDNIEVLEAADDPASDLVGTVRRSPLTNDAPFVKISSNCWYQVFVGGIIPFDDEWLSRPGHDVIGVVPGSPAAIALKPPTCPLVVNLGDPEPSRDIVLHSDFAGGFTWRKDYGGWYWTSPHHHEDEDRHSWETVVSEFDQNFPLTEIN